MKFAVIGTNFITDYFLDALRQTEGAHLTAVYSRVLGRAQEYAGKHGAPFAFDNLEALAECREVEAVYIASPNALHCAQAIMMLRAGKHVLCEKPMASNSAELAKMETAARENGVVLLEAVRHIHSPGLDAIRRRLEDLGPVRRVSFVKNQYSSRYDNYKAGIVENAFDPALSNGAIMDLGVYCISLLVALFGAPNSVRAEAVMLESGVDGQGFILARYSGFLAELSFSKISDSFAPSVIQGERGSLLLPELTRPENLTLARRGEQQVFVGCNCSENDIIYELTHFIEIVGGKRDAGFYSECSRLTAEITDQARRQFGLVFPADKIELD